MYYPQSEVIALLWLLLGLAGGGTWPALRQAIKVVDFEVFNLVFIPSAAPARRSANRAQQGLADRIAAARGTAAGIVRARIGCARRPARASAARVGRARRPRVGRPIRP